MQQALTLSSSISYLQKLCEQCFKILLLCSLSRWTPPSNCDLNQPFLKLFFSEYVIVTITEKETNKLLSRQPSRLHRQIDVLFGIFCQSLQSSSDSYFLKQNHKGSQKSSPSVSPLEFHKIISSSLIRILYLISFEQKRLLKQQVIVLLTAYDIKQKRVGNRNNIH